MIPYRPIAPLTAGPRRGWTSVVAAVVMAALLGTAAPAAVAAEAAPSSGVVSASVAPQGAATEPARREA